eukprot:380228_1
MSISKDIRNFFLYGAPHSFAFYVVHKNLFEGVINPDDYGFSKQQIDKGNYYTFLTANFFHYDAQHLLNNTIGFIPCCHRVISYLNKHKKWKSACIFWFIYLCGGIMANVGDYVLTSSWKKILLFFFRNDAKMIENINENYEGLNTKERKSFGASGCVCGLVGFNLCISIELIVKRVYYFYQLLDDDGLVELEKFEDRFDIKDYDLEETTKGDEVPDPDEIQYQISRYNAIKLCIDIIWFMEDGRNIYNGCLKRIYKDWIYRKEKRAGRDYLVAFSGMIGDYTHLCGIVSGIVLYGWYKIFIG